MVKGRKPLAKEVLEANGTKARNPGRYKKEPPTPASGSPQKPEHIARNHTASLAWDHAVEQMDAMKMSSKADLTLLTRYAESILFCKQAFDEGDVKAWKTACDVCMKVIGEMGLTPTSRMRLAAPKQDEQDAFTEWLAGYKGGVSLGDN